MLNISDNVKNMFYVIVVCITIIGTTTGIAIAYGEFRVRTLKNETAIERLADRFVENTKLLNQIKQDMEWIKKKIK